MPGLLLRARYCTALQLVALRLERSVLIRMPKPSPIVPAPAPQPKKKKPKRTRDDADDEMPPPELVQPSAVAAPSGEAAAHKPKKKKKMAQPPQPPVEEPADEPPSAEPAMADMLMTISDDRAFVGQTGPEIVAQPDRSDKPLRFLAWLVGPVGAEKFLKEFYGRRPLHVARSDRSYYDGWFSRAEMERQLRECDLRWTDEVDAARYAEGVRTTHNGEGVAAPAEVWARYAEGCSIRFSWPQRQSDPLWRMLSTLEEIFGWWAPPMAADGRRLPLIATDRSDGRGWPPIATDCHGSLEASSDGLPRSPRPPLTARRSPPAAHRPPLTARRSVRMCAWCWLAAWRGPTRT